MSIPKTLKIPTARVFEPLLRPARYKGVYGGRGSGKSHFFGELLVETCQAERGTLAVCIREAQRTLAQSSKRLIEGKIASLGLGRGFKLFNDKIATPGDGLIIFRGMHEHAAYRWKEPDLEIRTKLDDYTRSGYPMVEMNAVAGIGGYQPKVQDQTWTRDDRPEPRIPPRIFLPPYQPPAGLFHSKREDIGMCDCNRDFIDRAESITKNLYGEPLPPDRMAENFALYGLQRRAAALDRFDSELQGDIDSGAHNLRRRVQLMELRRKLGAVHGALRKAKR